MKCEKCKNREYNIKVSSENIKFSSENIKFSSEPVFSLTHGFGIKKFCRQCYIKELEIEIKECEKNIKEQKELIIKNVS